MPEGGEIANAQAVPAPLPARDQALFDAIDNMMAAAGRDAAPHTDRAPAPKATPDLPLSTPDLDHLPAVPPRAMLPAAPAPWPYVPPPYVAPARDHVADLALAGLAVTALVAVYQWRLILRTIRERAALAICAGLAILAVSLVIADPYGLDLGSQRLARFLDAGWMTLFGASVSLLGLYHWIAGPPQT